MKKKGLSLAYLDSEETRSRTMTEDHSSREVVGDTPRGLHHVELDKKGRVKLPASFHLYLSNVGEATVFITSLEEGVLRVYRAAVWLQHRETLWAKDTDESQQVSFMAEDRGRDSIIDKTGRLKIHNDLLPFLGEGRQPVVLEFYRDRINIYNQDAYTKKRLVVQTFIQNDVSILKRAGFR